MEKKKNLYESVEGKAADLYNKMRHRLAHSGNDYTKVWKKQQYRQEKAELKACDTQTKSTCTGTDQRVAVLLKLLELLSFYKD